MASLSVLALLVCFLVRLLSWVRKIELFGEVSNFPCLALLSTPAKVVANQIRFPGDPGRICHGEWRYFHNFAQFLPTSGQVYVKLYESTKQSL